MTENKKTGKKVSRRINTRTITVTAVFGAISAIIMFFEFSVPLMPGFVKFDFSDLPALIASFAYGPVFGVIICLIKNLIHLFATSSVGVGELSNFIISAVYTFTAGLIYKRHKNRNGALIGSAAGALVSSVLSVFTNLLIVYPIYAILYMPIEAILKAYQVILPSVDTLFEALLIFNLPFTFIKGIVVAAICFIIYKPLSPILKGRK